MTPYARYIGHVNGNEYVNYKNMWIKEESYPHSINDGKFYLADFGTYTEFSGDILDANFLPVMPQIINLKNENFMLISSDGDVVENDSNIFTFISDIEGYIVDGRYTESGRDDLFKYVNEDGELFALLNDPHARVPPYLVSATKNISLIIADGYKVEYENGLYNGYEIIYDERDCLFDFFEENKENYENGCEGYDDSVNIIYQYKDILFSRHTEMPLEIIVLDARKPNSGAKTKAAIKQLNN